MPSKNTVKTYYENGFYHVYNRGVEKRVIFLDKQDAEVYLHYLKMYLSPIKEIKQGVLFGNVKTKFIQLNLSEEVELLSFALMPNHFHLLLKQTSRNGVTKLLKRITTAYVMYFNQRYKRVGPLFQGVFKACPVTTDEYLLHLSRYIHLNPQKIQSAIDFNSFSSLDYYLGRKHANWIKPEFVLNFYNRENKNLNYETFIKDKDNAQLSNDMLGEITLEENCFDI